MRAARLLMLVALATPYPHFDPSHRHKPQKRWRFRVSDPSQRDCSVTDQNANFPRRSAGCDGVTDQTVGS